MKLSDEALILVRNWDTVSSILEAINDLKKTLALRLHSLEQDFVREEWWKNEWSFICQNAQQVYVVRKAFRTKEQDPVWVGVEGFTPAALFGNDDSSQLYVWVAGNRTSLAQTLAKMISENGTDIPGTIDKKQTSYVVRGQVQKYIDGEVDAYLAEVGKQIRGFISFYGAFFTHNTAAIEKMISNQTGSA